MRHRGFTLLELLVVLAILAVAAAGVTWSIRDGRQTALEREAVRLAALLEAARAQSQASGVTLRWRPTADGFVFEPPVLPGPDRAAQRWLEPGTRAEVAAASAWAGQSPGVLLLGPEPLLAPQAVLLHGPQPGQAPVRVASDGLRPFAVQSPSEPW